MKWPRFTLKRMGREQEPIVVIDDFAADPEALRAAAVIADFTAAKHHYPGIRAALPATYLPTQLAVLADPLRDVFGQEDTASVIDASFSIVTTPRAELSVRQRLPHCDAFTADRVALVHYLMPQGGEGTAFFRHRSTGFEFVDEARAPIFFDQLDAEIRLNGPPPSAYIGGNTAYFETTTQIDAVYNRAILYRSRSLHSGAITSDSNLSRDPAIGRLTITAFLTVA